MPSGPTGPLRSVIGALVEGFRWRIVVVAMIAVYLRCCRGSVPKDQLQLIYEN